MIKVKTFGARGNILCQIDRIDIGLLALGCELTDNEPNLIYCNDAGYHKEAIEYKKKYPNAKLILNILDLPFHVPEINDILDNLYCSLQNCDAVTTISETVKSQMLSSLPFLQNKGISVIYQPTKPINNLNLQSENKNLLVGRQGDSNKNCRMAVECCNLLGINTSVVGPEDIRNIVNPVFRRAIEYHGVVNDEDLNVLYNTHNFGLIVSRIEGLGLSGIEMILSGNCIPIVSNQMQTAKEFYPAGLIVNHNLYDISNKINEVINNKERYLKILAPIREKYIKQFSPESVAFNIINTYEKIK